MENITPALISILTVAMTALIAVGVWALAQLGSLAKAKKGTIISNEAINTTTDKLIDDLQVAVAQAFTDAVTSANKFLVNVINKGSITEEDKAELKAELMNKVLANLSEDATVAINNAIGDVTVEVEQLVNDKVEEMVKSIIQQDVVETLELPSAEE